MFTRLQQEYEEKFHMTWVGKYGFNNTFTVAVRGDVAEQYGLETTSDLAGAAGELTSAETRTIWSGRTAFQPCARLTAWTSGMWWTSTSA